MPGRRARGRSALSLFLWLLNGGAAVLLLAIVFVYLTREPAQASGSPFVYVGGTPRPTSTGAPTSFYLPTVTPNPLATPIEDYSTPTPFVFLGGPEARIIGYSVQGDAHRLLRLWSGRASVSDRCRNSRRLRGQHNRPRQPDGRPLIGAPRYCSRGCHAVCHYQT